MSDLTPTQEADAHTSHLTSGTVAPSPEHLLRPRLTERLTRAARFPIALILAPAGFGKSVALRDFLRTKAPGAVVCVLDRADDSLAAFVRALTDALAPLVPSARATLAALQQQVMAGGDPVTTTLDWLAAHIAPVTATIVIDDLQFAAADPHVVPLLAGLIEGSSERIRWIIATRPDVELPVAAWVGYGRMDLPVSEDELRFNLDEARAAATALMMQTPAGEIEALRELTGGWPLALAIALRTRMHAADLRAATLGTRELLHRYLAEHVYAAADAAQREFLLASCLFSDFDLSLVAAFGLTPSAFMQLRRKIAFIAEFAPETFRYHDLFRGYLERELRNAGDDAWRAAHRRAADLLTERADDAPALLLSTAIGDAERIVQILERSGLELIERGHAEVVAGALDALPEAERAAHPAALGVRAVFEANRGHFDVAERCFREAIERATDAESRLALIHRYAIELVRSDRDCTDLLEPLVSDPGLAARWKVLLEGTLATAHAGAGRLRDAQTVIALAIDRVETLPDRLRARIYQQAAYVYQFASRDRALRYAQRAVELAQANGLFEIAARAYSILYTFANEEDDDPLASLAILDNLADAARKGASLQVRIFGLIAAYEIEAERGNDAALDRLDGEIGTVPEHFSRTRVESLLPAQALRAAWSGDLHRAYEILAGSHEHQGSDERRALRAAEIAVYAFASGETAAGVELTAAAARILEETGGPPRGRVHTLLMLALAELTHGRLAAAHRWLAAAETQVTPAMRRLRVLAAALRVRYRIALGRLEPRGFDDAAQRLRDAHFGGIARLLDVLPIESADAAGYAALTQTERVILIQLADGASSKEIAARSGRSSQTVDTHIRSICRKLRCSGRREAVAVARRTGWLDR